jgi:hypothetical protein
MASQSHKIRVADSSSSRHLSQVGSSVNPSLKRCPFRWQCPVNSPTTQENCVSNQNLLTNAGAKQWQVYCLCFAFSLIFAYLWYIVCMSTLLQIALSILHMKLWLYNHNDLVLNTDGQACSMHWKQQMHTKSLSHKIWLSNRIYTVCNLLCIIIGGIWLSTQQ